MAAPKGQIKRGGRQKGTPNKRNKRREAEVAAIEEGLTPLQYMINTMRDKKASEAMRMDAAKAAAGYIHPKAVTTVNLDAKLNITEVRDVIIDPADTYDTDIEGTGTGEPDP